MHTLDTLKKLDALKIHESTVRHDREYQDFTKYEKMVTSGISSPNEILIFLESSGTRLQDCIYFLELSLKAKRVNFFNAILELSIKKHPNNIHLMYYKAILGNNVYLSNLDLDLFIKSGIFKYMEFAFSYKVSQLKLTKDFESVKGLFNDIINSPLPIGFKKPYLDLFSRITKSMGIRKPDIYDELVIKLIQTFKEKLDLSLHPWYLKLYLRMHMYILQKYDNKIIDIAIKTNNNNQLDLPTAQYNLLHLYNYSTINNIDYDFSSLDPNTLMLLENHPSTLMLRENKRILTHKSKGKKVAILIAGQVRGLIPAQIRLLNSEGYEFDIYISVWENKGFKVPYNLVKEPYYRIFEKTTVDTLFSLGLLGESLYLRYPSILSFLKDNAKVDIHTLKTHQWINTNTQSSVKKVAFVNESQDYLDIVFKEYKLKNMENVALHNQLKMFYMNYNSYLLMCEEEKNTLTQYDYILKLRPDIETQIDIKEIINEIANKQAISADVMRDYDCGDRVAFGNRLIMSQYMMMFKNLHIYQNNPNVMYGCGRFKAHAPIDYQVVSSGGQIYRSKHLGVKNFIDLDIIPNETIFEILLRDAKNRGFDDVDKKLFENLGINIQHS